LAREALDRIGELYGIEEEIRGQLPELRQAQRLARAGPKLDVRVASRNFVTGCLTRHVTETLPYLSQSGCKP
jgi:hypothetical protein